MRRDTLVCLCVSANLMLVMPALGATAPDAGQVLQEQRQTPSHLPERLPGPEEQVAPSGPAAERGPTVVVKGFRFTGIQGVATEAELERLLRDAVGREQSMAELQQLARRVTAYLHDKGYLLARAYLPQQDITSGIVEIAVIAGRVEGAPEIRLQEPSRLRPGMVAAMVGSGARTGQAVQDKALERSLLLMNDLPGISAHATLERGETPGTTRVVVDASEGPLLSGAVSADNFGNRFTGAWRATAQAAANDPLGLGDQLSVSATGAEHLASGQVDYQLPVGTSGLQAGLSYTGLSYELGKEFSALDAEGRADTVGLRTSYPYVRSRAFSLWQSVSYEYRSLEDKTAGVETSDRDVNVGGTAITASTYDHAGGGGLTSLRAGVKVGHLRLENVGDAAADDAGPQAAGGFFTFSYSVARLQRLSEDFSLFGSASGQLANGNLDSSEKFLLGGPSGVRAYPVGEGAGDEGHGFTLELRYDVPRRASWGNLQLVGFYDAGNVTLHAKPWENSVSTATGKNSYWISGGGLGVNLDKPGRYAVRASWAAPVGDNPGRGISGQDADNKSADNRFWLQGIFWF